MSFTLALRRVLDRERFGGEDGPVLALDEVVAGEVPVASRADAGRSDVRSELRSPRPADEPSDRRGAASDGATGAGAVSFEGVAKVYRRGGVDGQEVAALSDISLDVPPGSIFGIIGRSGAGKSTLLRTINLLERPTAGRVLVDGVDPGGLDEAGLVALRRRIGMIFQHFNLLSAKTVLENVALPLRVAGVDKETAAARVTELLGLVGLQDKRDSYPGRLSGGQKQRVGIARALATRPQILLCDEATSALDPETTQSILDLLRDINRRLGITVILITHEMSVIREIADRVLVLEGGRIAELGEVWQVFGAPRHPATQALLAPLQRSLPTALQTQLSVTPPAGPHERVLALVYTGEGGLTPDLPRIVAALGPSTRLLQGGLERIQGHPLGRLLVASDGDAPVGEIARFTQGPRPIAHAIEVLGHVPARSVHSC